MATRSKNPSNTSYQEFEKALELVHKRQYEDAQKLLSQLGKKASDDRLSARIGTYLKICERALAAQPKEPTDAESLYDHGVFAHNQGDYETARTHYKAALKKAGEKDSAPILVALAATEAKGGEKTASLTYLKKAIQTDANVRFLALGDADFERLRQTDAFKRLVELPD